MCRTDADERAANRGPRTRVGLKQLPHQRDFFGRFLDSVLAEVHHPGPDGLHDRLRGLGLRDADQGDLFGAPPLLQRRLGDALLQAREILGDIRLGPQHLSPPV